MGRWADGLRAGEACLPMAQGTASFTPGPLHPKVKSLTQYLWNPKPTLGTQRTRHVGLAISASECTHLTV